MVLLWVLLLVQLFPQMVNLGTRGPSPWHLLACGSQLLVKLVVQPLAQLVVQLLVSLLAQLLVQVLAQLLAELATGP